MTAGISVLTYSGWNLCILLPEWLYTRYREWPAVENCTDTFNKDGLVRVHVSYQSCTVFGLKIPAALLNNCSPPAPAWGEWACYPAICFCAIHKHHLKRIKVLDVNTNALFIRTCPAS